MFRLYLKSVNGEQAGTLGLPSKVNAPVHSESASSRNFSKGIEKKPKVSLFRNKLLRLADSRGLS